ncbi:MAG: glycosyltransferase family 4 protein [Thermoplasmata archaeon]
MRIAQICPFYAPHAGGVESHVGRLSRQLVRLGHEVTVVTSRFDPRLPLRETVDGVAIRRVPVRGVWLNTPIDPKVASEVKELRADVAHLHYPPPLTPYFAARGLRGRPMPLVLTYHCDLYLPGPAGRLLTGIVEGLLLPSVLRRADRIIVHTQSYGATSSMLRGRAIDVIPSLVDVDRFQPTGDAAARREVLGLTGRRVLVGMGRVVPHKGFDTALRMLPLLPEDVHLVLIGSGPALPRLVGLARRLGVAHRVRFLSDVRDEEVPSYLALGDVFVYPSQNRLEGFGLAIVEAMAAGLPVVIADMPGVREVIEANREGLLAEPMIPQDFARKVRTLLDDPSRARAMGRVGRQRVAARFSVPTVTAQIESVYRQLAEAGPRP